MSKVQMYKSKLQPNVNATDRVLDIVAVVVVVVLACSNRGISDSRYQLFWLAVHSQSLQQLNNNELERRLEFLLTINLINFPSPLTLCPLPLRGIYNLILDNVGIHLHKVIVQMMLDYNDSNYSRLPGQLDLFWSTLIIVVASNVFLCNPLVIIRAF